MHRVGDADPLPSFERRPPPRTGARGEALGRRRGGELDPGSGSAVAPGNRLSGRRGRSLRLAREAGYAAAFAAWLGLSLAPPFDDVLPSGTEGDSLARREPSHRDRESEPTIQRPVVLVDGTGHGDTHAADGGPARHGLLRCCRLRGGWRGCGRHGRCDCTGCAAAQQDPDGQTDEEPRRRVVPAQVHPSGPLAWVGLASSSARSRRPGHGPRIRASRCRVDAP